LPRSGHLALEFTPRLTRAVEFGFKETSKISSQVIRTRFFREQKIGKKNAFYFKTILFDQEAVETGGFEGREYICR